MVRVHCATGAWASAEQLVAGGRNPASAYHMGRLHEAAERIEDALRCFAVAGKYARAARLAKRCARGQGGESASEVEPAPSSRPFLNLGQLATPGQPATSCLPAIAPTPRPTQLRHAQGAAEPCTAGGAHGHARRSRLPPGSGCAGGGLLGWSRARAPHPVCICWRQRPTTPQHAGHALEFSICCPDLFWFGSRLCFLGGTAQRSSSLAAYLRCLLHQASTRAPRCCTARAAALRARWPLRRPRGCTRLWQTLRRRWRAAAGAAAHVNLRCRAGGLWPRRPEGGRTGGEPLKGWQVPASAAAVLGLGAWKVRQSVHGPIAPSAPAFPAPGQRGGCTAGGGAVRAGSARVRSRRAPNGGARNH